MDLPVEDYLYITKVKIFHIICMKINMTKLLFLNKGQRLKMDETDDAWFQKLKWQMK